MRHARLRHRATYTRSELSHFRKRIGGSGVRLILEESIRVNEDHDEESGGMAFMDSTVQEKNITCPTDAKLLEKVVRRCMRILRKHDFPVRQSHTRTLKQVCLDRRFRSNPRNHKRAARADRKLRTIAGRLVRELDRNPASSRRAGYEGLLSVFCRILEQKRDTKNKVYSIHEPGAECTGKGKEHRKYEFGNKVSTARTEGGLTVGAVSFRNEHDGKTPDATLKQVELNTGRLPKQAACGRGYRGVREANGVPILIPGTPKKSDSYHKRRKRHSLFCRRAAIEPTIGHIKSDHRMSRNYLRGVVGDAVSLMLSAAAFNFKRAMRAFLDLIRRWWERWCGCPSFPKLMSVLVRKVPMGLFNG